MLINVVLIKKINMHIHNNNTTQILQEEKNISMVEPYN